MSQAEVARLAGVQQSTIGNLEAGHRQQPRELLRIAAALEVTPDWLATGEGSMTDGAPPPMEWPFELIARGQWQVLSERQRGVVEAAAMAAIRSLNKD